MLEPISAQEATNYYLRNRADEVSHETHRKHGDRLKQFVIWCDETDRTNLNDLTGRDLLEFKEWRSQGIKQITLKNNLWTLKKFLRFCEDIDAVPPGLSEKVLMPKTDPEQEAREVYVSKEEADAILVFLKKYEYATCVTLSDLRMEMSFEGVSLVLIGYIYGPTLVSLVTLSIQLSGSV